MPESFPTNQGAGHSLERLNSKDLRVLLLWLLAGLIGVGVAHRYFFRAFPEAAVNFKVTRAAALDEARAFAAAQGAPVRDPQSGYQSSIVFSVDDDQKTYLEREVGLEQANRLMSSEVNVWYWEVRFFRPLQKEEFDVRVDPAGRIVGYEHVMEEAAAGARPERGAALARAEEFLRDTLHTPVDGYTFLPEEANSVSRPNRTDWSFTWERTGFRAKDAPYRLRVALEGDRIGGYQEFLKVPEAWQRSFASLRSSNDLIEMIAIFPYALLMGAALSVVTALGRRGLLQWGDGIKLGLFITVLYFLNTINQWPLARAAYNTNDSYSSFWLSQMGAAIATSVALALLVVIAYVPGEPLYRMGQPERLRLGSVLSLPGLRSKEFFCSGVIGVCLAGAHIGYVVLFYVIGRRFGVWAPQDLQYSDTLSTALPWLFPLTIGIYAACSEEFLFRMFSIRFLLRATNSRVLAVLLPAFAWGFLHSNYPQEPPYIRGIEVGLIGIVAGLVMLRWGILATLTWHYTVDAFLTGLSLMRSGDHYSQISGAVVGFAAFIPIGIAGALYLARGGFAPSDALLNGAAPLAEIPVEQPKAAAAPLVSRYTPLAAGGLAVLGLCGALGGALLWAVKPASIGEFVRFSLDARQTQARADEVLRQQHVDPESYRRVATIQYTFNSQVNEYLRRSIGTEAANRIYRDAVPSAFWSVRYFRDSQKEEYLVVLLPDGGLHSVHHTLAESTPGANLSKEDAQALAAAFLQQNKGINLAGWRVVTAESNKRPARTDHTFEWEQTAPLNLAPADGEGAHVRVQLQVQGDEVSGYRVFIHVPEEWTRKQNEETLASTVRGIGFAGLAAAFCIAVLVVLFRNLKQPGVAMVPWRPLARGSLLLLAAALVNFVTLAPQYLWMYNTDLPFRTFLVTRAIGLSLSAVLLYSAAIMLFGLASFFLARSYGAESLGGWSRRPAAYYRDALWVGLCGCVALPGFLRVFTWLGRVWPVARTEFPANVPQGLDAAWPALHALAGGVTLSFLAIGGLALALGFASCYLRPAWLQVFLLAVLAVLIVPRSGSTGEFAQQALAGFLIGNAIWWGARRLVRFNLLGYILVVMLLTLAAAAQELLRQPNEYFRVNGGVLVAAMALLLCWPLFGWLSGDRGNALGNALGNGSGAGGGTEQPVPGSGQ